MPTDILADGDLTRTKPGSYSLVLQDAAGQTIYDIPFNAESKAQIAPIGKVDVGVSPFALAVPFIPQAMNLVIAKDGRQIFIRSIIGLTLRDAITSVPTAAFHGNKPELERLLLLKTTALIEASQQRSKNNCDSIALLKVLRGEVQRLIKRDFVSQSPIEYNQARVISLIDRLINSLSSANSIKQMRCVK